MRIPFLLLLLSSVVLCIPVEDSLIKLVRLHTATLQLPTTRQGKNFDICSDDSDCEGSRICAPQDGTDCREGDDCNCAPTLSPICPLNDCDEGETCARLPDSEIGLCISDQVIADSNGVLVPFEEDPIQSPNTTVPSTTEATTVAATTTEVITTTVGSDTTTTAVVTSTTDAGDDDSDDTDSNDCPDD